MNQIANLILFSFSIAWLSGCQNIYSFPDKDVRQNTEPFITYTPLEGATNAPMPLQIEFTYEDGCLLGFYPRTNEWMTPVFPKGDASFDYNRKVIRILNTEYKMGEVLSGGGSRLPYNPDYIDTYDNVPPERCITEYLAVYYGEYEKIKWGE